jgi:cyclophilin family peptidyl-prolyl cis-trans isomerase
MVPLLKRLVDAFDGQVRVVYRHFPLISIHDKAVITAEAAEAAGAQGAFWEMHDLIYERQAEWASTPAEEMPQVLSGYAKELGLDTKTFDQALADGVYTEKVMDAYEASTTAGLTGTPSFVADGVHYPAQQWGLSYQGLDVFSRLIAMKGRQFDTLPTTVIEEGKQYQATIQTEKGDIVVELYADQTPVTVNSFVFLAEQGWYDDTIFHRVIPGFVAQMGDPTATGIGWPGYRCSDELTPDLTFDGPGVLGMANSGPDTNGSQFFITLAAQPDLDGRHTVFGRVIAGMDVVESLAARDPQEVPPDQPGDRILGIVVEEQ